MPTFFAVATPGLEAVVARELSAHGLAGEVQPGGVAFEGELTLAWLAASLRTPARLRVQVVAGRARSLDELAGLVRRGDWRAFLRPGDRVEVAVSSRQSRLRFKDAIAGKVERAVLDGLGRPRSRGGATQQLSVRVDDDEVAISVDAGGELLHRRGWRLATAKAPLRENLAAALLLAAGYEGDEALLDPFCGAGTIPIEAARLARGLPPGEGRSYACETWPALRGSRAPTAEARPLLAPIVGADRDPGAVRAAIDNARRARVAVDWRHQDIRELEAPGPTGLVVTNPPYGTRVGGSGAGGAYAALGIALRGPLRGWRALFLAPSADLARKVDRDAERLTTFSNGGIKVGAWAVEG